jgi:hypothetical protein
MNSTQLNSTQLDSTTICTHEFLFGHGLFTVSLPLIIDYRMQAAFTGQLWNVGSNYLLYWQAGRLTVGMIMLYWKRFREGLE